MHEYIIIISQLREGATLRGLSRDKLADRKTLRKVRDIAIEQGWLEKDKPIPSEQELALFFEKSSANSFLSIQPYRVKIEEWTRQGVQASTIYAHLQREHGFKSRYSVVQRYIKSYKEKQRAVTTILEYASSSAQEIHLHAMLEDRR